MGKTFQIRGTLQVIDLRTLNAEISETLKQDIDEVDDRSVKEFDIAGGVIDQEVNWLDAGISVANMVYLVADCPLMVKFNSVLSAPIACSFLLQMGEIQKMFLSPTVGTHVRIIALTGHTGP
jgi:hypothetical protein